MRKYVEPHRQQWDSLTRRVGRDDAMLEWRVAGILEQIRKGGDSALRQVSEAIEGFTLRDYKVTKEEIEAACDRVPEDLKAAITEAASRIRTFHELEKPTDIEWNDGAGTICRRKYLPIRRVGLYIPGGTAPLFSTVLMLGVPSLIAGCRERIMFTPPSKDGSVAPAILFAASLCGIDEIYKIGGSQAVAAMAYGTESIAKVDKIFGPGNRYVMKAKQLVGKEGVATDMPAGPSEVLVIADESANVSFVAADLLSQAEHGPDSQVVLLSNNVTTARSVLREIDIQKESLSRKGIVDAALTESRIIVMKDLDECVDFANLYAPEHLILAVKDPEALALKVEAAGSVFLGHYSPESAGDYASGTNHILPTGGTAVAWNGLGVESFMHAVTFQSLSDAGLQSLGGTIATMADAEMLEAHANAVRVRVGGGIENK
ncbi:MAG: histidinol dehydrogenase [Bacteroidales bacterium]|nr:histidinol dehydrogenase [Bacteroidales bacterium]